MDGNRSDPLAYNTCKESPWRATSRAHPCPCQRARLGCAETEPQASLSCVFNTLVVGSRCPAAAAAAVATRPRAVRCSACATTVPTFFFFTVFCIVWLVSPPALPRRACRPACLPASSFSRIPFLCVVFFADLGVAWLLACLLTDCPPPPFLLAPPQLVVQFEDDADQDTGKTPHRRINSKLVLAQPGGH